jgi:hypothetical protein
MSLYAIVYYGATTLLIAFLVAPAANTWHCPGCLAAA